MSVRQTHPSSDQLTMYARGGLTPDEHAEVEQHLSQCPSCRQILAQRADQPNKSDFPKTAPFVSCDTPGSATVASLGTKSPSLSDDLPPELASHPRYRLIRCLGVGGMGVVYQAEHRIMERTVALKVIHSELTSQSTAVQRFLLEVKAAARLTHPNIVTAHDAEQVTLADGNTLHFLVMEYVEGINLARLVEQRGPLPIDQACYFIRQAALGLQHAHELGLIHRDIKPHNMMVTRKSQLKVLDFGLARLIEESTPSSGSQRPLTSMGMVIGTPDYIAPEQVGNSHQVDIRADIYSLGCTFYFLLTGQPPYPEGNSLEKAFAHVEGTPTPLGQLRPNVPASIVEVLARMMARKPADRYQTPEELARALAPLVRSSRSVPVVSLPAKSAPSDPTPAPTRLPAAKSAATTPVPRKGSASTTTSAVRAVSRSRVRRRTKSRRWPMIALGIGLALVLLLLVGGAITLRNNARANRRNSSQAGQLVTNNRTPPRVLIVLPHCDFWCPDYLGVRSVLDQSGALVSVASSQLEPATPHSKGGGELVKPDLELSAVRAANYDAVIFVGGFRLEYLEPGPSARDAAALCREMFQMGKLVMSTCNGCKILAEAGLLDGKEATGFPDPEVQPFLSKHGAQFVQRDVVRVGNIITGRGGKSITPFANEMVDALTRR